ncbi:hypothetical protein NP233_g7119 [Leucocoprinus birnbaumii]|uniref:F-box domain-containing protein n=1 Tax=Leucocoprinus birnbaumii TaxID=56174 RepID=A0AAD5YT33_9AGAR|nr:hypothetical protein NP233_g7119 [Leucocoprinus birnbaumii]
MKQFSDSVGRLWQRVTHRRRTQNDLEESQPQSQPQRQVRRYSVPLPPATEPDPWLEVERQLLYHRFRQRLPTPEPQPRPDPPPQPPLIIAPVSHSIPVIQGNLSYDVLSQIFMIYNHVSRDNYNDYMNEGIPWILGQICHSWRQVALNTPTCWNSFTLEITEDNADNDLPEMHQALLARSADASLRISFDFSRYNEPIPGRPFRIIEPLLERCTQWTTILLQGLDVPELHRQFRPARNNLPSLWSLKFYFRSRTTRDSVVLPGERVLLPWNQIKTYGAYSAPGNPFPDELERQPNLESLTTIYNDFPSITPHPIVHQNLRELYVYATQNIEAGFEQLKQLTLPSLELLVLTFMTMELRHNVSIIATVISLIQNSKCNLKSLAIQQNCNLYIDRLPVLFSLTPSLETLDIGHGTWFRDTLSALRFDPKKETLLPNLKRLVIAYTVGTNPVDIKFIRELVESRKQAFTDSASTGQLFCPLLYIRLHIKRSETRYWCFMDLEDRYAAPEGHTKTDAYPLDLYMDEEWEPKLAKAADELRLLLSSPTHDTAQIVSKYHEVEDIYRRRILCTTGRMLNPRNGECQPVKTIRALVNTYIPDEYLRQRRWIMASDCNLFYLHPDHEARISTQKDDIIIGLKFPPATSFEGYGYWFNADIDRQMENLRPFIC